MEFGSEIAERLKKFAADNEWDKEEFAAKLDISVKQLNSYLNGRRIPGNKMKAKLEELNCNITWLLTGIYPNAELQRKAIEREIEETKILNNLKLIGLDTWDKINEILAPTMRAAEKIEEYSRKGKRK